MGRVASQPCCLPSILQLGCCSFECTTAAPSPATAAVAQAASQQPIGQPWSSWLCYLCGGGALWAEWQVSFAACLLSAAGLLFSSSTTVAPSPATAAVAQAASQQPAGQPWSSWLCYLCGCGALGQSGKSALLLAFYSAAGLLFLRVLLQLCRLLPQRSQRPHRSNQQASLGLLGSAICVAVEPFGRVASQLCYLPSILQLGCCCFECTTAALSPTTAAVAQAVAATNRPALVLLALLFVWWWSPWAEWQVSFAACLLFCSWAAVSSSTTMAPSPATAAVAEAASQRPTGQPWSSWLCYLCGGGAFGQSGKSALLLAFYLQLGCCFLRVLPWLLVRIELE